MVKINKTARDLWREAVARGNYVPATAQIRAYVRLTRRQGYGMPESVFVHPEYCGVQYEWIFVGIERDGYTHT